MFVHAYHEATKHHFHRFAASLGYLDWATQPDPFRRFAGARVDLLPRAAFARGAPYAALFDASVPGASVAEDSVGELLRCSMGLSAWKQLQRSRWALRVNPSSGNLHPTEAYVVHHGRVCHYAPREHALEERCRLDASAWSSFAGARTGFLVALTSIHWREAWKYGERAFRYCQHDTGHAIAALRFAAAMLGWKLALLPSWSSEQMAAVTGVDREDDYRNGEREEPECVAAVTPAGTAGWLDADPSSLVDAARRAVWHGKANRLSTAHIEWPAIDRVAEATRSPGFGTRARSLAPEESGGRPSVPAATAPGIFPLRESGSPAPHPPLARAVLLRRRSAVAFDARSSLPRTVFMDMLRRLRPSGPPWDALCWPPQVHLVLFVHRVDGLVPGIYACLRSPDALPEWRAALRPEFLWEPVNDSNASNGLFLLAPLDVTSAANRVSCDQDIAADGFFSLGMIARFDASLAEYGEWFYRHLYWECGMIGQVLYLEAEAAGARATGIGCFYDDAVHEMVGLKGTAWQSLYHFSMGMPIDDARLTTQPGYEWEA